jgi:gliding motility-associated-like protein
LKNGLENIDEVFKQAFDGFEANVDPSVWTNIQNSIASGTTPPTDPVSTSVATTITKTVALKIAAAVIAVGTIATATFFIVTSQKETKEVVAENNIEQPVIELVEEAIIIEETNDNKKEIIVKEVTPVIIKEESKIENIKKDNEIPPVIENKTGTAPTNNQKTKTADNQKEAESQNDKEDSSLPTKTNEKQIVEKTVNEDKEKETTNTVPEVKPKKEVNITKAIPNIFTPNGDGQNDIFKITGDNIDKMEVAIMDKTGKVLYVLKSVEDEWQGKDMGGYDLPSGMYFIAGSVKDKEENVQVIKQVIQLNR